MTLIPTALCEKWTNRARRGALSKLKSLLEFRELVPEYKAENVLMQAYKEAAAAMLCAPETLRDDMGKIREYSQEKLTYWLSNGLSFEHLETSNRLAEVAKKTPARLLDESIDPGNATGDPMTVDELTAFALGEVPQNQRGHVVGLVVMFERLRKFPTKYKWDNDKTERFTSWLEQGKEFLT